MEAAHPLCYKAVIEDETQQKEKKQQNKSPFSNAALSAVSTCTPAQVPFIVSWVRPKL